MEGSIYERLAKVQSELKAPKGQYNNFGKFHYRSCEDILDAVKSLLVENELTLTLTDEPCMIDDWHYIKATAHLRHGEELVITNAYAREPFEKKGMDESQISGSTSSYARKYCLAGLFLIGSEDDADSQEPQKPRYKPIPKNEPKPKHKPVSELDKAKKTLAEAISVYAMSVSMDKDGLMRGVTLREDYEEGKEDPDWFYMVAEEFGYQGGN